MRILHQNNDPKDTVIIDKQIKKSHILNVCCMCVYSTENGEVKSLSRCGGCRFVFYCDRDCQKKGWDDGHKWECKGFKATGNIPGPFTRLLLRIIVKLKVHIFFFNLLA